VLALLRITITSPDCISISQQSGVSLTSLIEADGPHGCSRGNARPTTSLNFRVCLPSCVVTSSATSPVIQSTLMLVSVASWRLLKAKCSTPFSSQGDVCDRQQWVTSRHFTSIFSTGGFLALTGPSVFILANFGSRPEGAIASAQLRAISRTSTMDPPSPEHASYRKIIRQSQRLQSPPEFVAQDQDNHSMSRLSSTSLA